MPKTQLCTASLLEVVKSCYSSFAFQHSPGLSLHFSWTEEILPRYCQLQFFEWVKKAMGKAEPKAWVKFLQRYLETSRCSLRHTDKGVRCRLLGLAASEEVHNFHPPPHICLRSRRRQLMERQ